MMPLHEVTLQRLGVYHMNAGKRTFYPVEHFAATVDKWNGMPVILATPCPGEPVKHPDFGGVIAGTLAPSYRVVGQVRNPRMAETGEPSLVGAIEFTDPILAARATAGLISISTGFGAAIAPDEQMPGANRIAGPVRPNHVLVFERGSCRNCFPNDAGARFCNTPEDSDPEKDALRQEIARVKAEIEELHNRDPAAMQREIRDELAFEAMNDEFKKRYGFGFGADTPRPGAGDKAADEERARQEFERLSKAYEQKTKVRFV